jgi:hypothetical protein
VELYALVATDSDFAVDVFVTQANAQQALAEVLADEPAFAPLLEIVALPPPWLEGDRAFTADSG